MARERSLPDDDDDEDDRPRRRASRSRDDDDEEEDDDRPRRRRRRRDDDESDDAMNLVVPVNVSGWAIAAGYAGLLSCVPLIGFFVGIAALVFGFKALKDSKKRGSIGSANGMLRAWVGIVLGGISVVGHLFILILAIIQGK